MLVFEAIKEATEEVFVKLSGLEEKVPVLPILWKDKLEALEKNGLTDHYSSCLFDMRCWQAKEMGFQSIDSSDMVEMLMGEKHTDSGDVGERQIYEWVYNHHTDESYDTSANWGGVPTLFKRIVRNGFWYLPPFSKKTLWAVQFGKLNYLKRDIPYGVVLRIAECKELKLFNSFNVMAPIEAWERKTDVDPIVVATIWEMPPKKEGKGATAGQAQHFFLAQW